MARVAGADPEPPREAGRDRQRRDATPPRPTRWPESAGHRSRDAASRRDGAPHVRPGRPVRLRLEGGRGLYEGRQDDRRGQRPPARGDGEVMLGARYTGRVAWRRRYASRHYVGYVVV